ncbi:unnamed protein product [Peronospora destructor]|uniref:Malic enzyme n=1 Tax=Peronospora destructor TaxID=86335 RepID=A0AAV0TYD7_9STRA|nr:unnamed protein product [Peronospora destructor]
MNPTLHRPNALRHSQRDLRQKQVVAARAAISYIASERPSTALANKRQAGSLATVIPDKNVEDHAMSQPGFAVMRKPTTNKGQAFTEEERAAFKLRGLLPVAVICIEIETESNMNQLHTSRVVLSINDIGNVAEILDNWPEKDIRAIYFTDGERILGLGGQGANGMGIPVGKLALYTVCAGVPPRMCLPVVLDCGTNNEECLADRFYIGLRQKRFEDFGNSTAFNLLRKYQNTHCTFNDDIQGTASVVLAGLLAAVPMTGKPISKQNLVFLGAGLAGTGIADLISLAISRETGKKAVESRKQISLVDSRGLVVKSRTDSLQPHKLPYARDAPECEYFVGALDRIKPTALIGVTIAKSFNKEVCEKMTKEAYTFTNGKCIFASGSPFDPVEINGKLCVPGQGNNSYIFPGVGLGVVASSLIHVDDEIMIIAAKTLASLTTPADLETGCVYPPVSNIRDVSLKVAEAVAEYGFQQGFFINPKPENITQYVETCASLGIFETDNI